jgi:hypothetical protein
VGVFENASFSAKQYRTATPNLESKMGKRKDVSELQFSLLELTPMMNNSISPFF